jgi:hypothetical protein
LIHNQAALDKHSDYQSTTLKATGFPDRDISQTATFPPVYFLDPDVLKVNTAELPCVYSLSIPGELQHWANSHTDRREIASIFFQSFHFQVPFIPKKLCYESYLNPLIPPKADVRLLFLCMKLLTAPLSGSNVRTREYLALKMAFLSAEIAGVLTLPLLQALILTASYELGHAIYPSAFLTIGTCARYATALGLDMSSIQSGGGAEIEDKRRAWWVIVILDRCVSLPHHLRSNSPVPILPHPLKY